MIKLGFQQLMRQRFFLQCLIGLCIVSMVSSVEVSPQPQSEDAPVSVERAAIAQTASSESIATIDDSAIDNYARAVLGIEEIRQSTLSEIKVIIGSDAVPTISCHQAQTLEELPRDAQDRVVSFCQSSIGLVEKNDLSIEEFNQITNAQRNDDELAQAIQDALLRIQTTTVDEESVSRVE